MFLSEDLRIGGSTIKSLGVVWLVSAPRQLFRRFYELADLFSSTTLRIWDRECRCGCCWFQASADRDREPVGRRLDHQIESVCNQKGPKNRDKISCARGKARW